jgi:hypothetical protein
MSALLSASGVKRVVWAMAITVAVTIAGCAAPQPKPPAPIDHVMVLVFDQMRPDYIDRFGLANFKRLRATSRNYPQAYVGHMSSQTIVAHIVIPTGLPPKSLPWQDEAFLDRDGVFGKPDLAYRTDELGRDGLWRLLESVPPEQYLQTRIRKKFGGRVFAVGEKDYAATLFGTHADSLITLEKAAGRCEPDGVNIPAYIASNDRYRLECAESYGTGLSTIYALDGNHYVPGRDPAHLGGDVWTADVALDVMAHEQWSGLFVTFGAIDKIAHMLGEQDGHGITSVPSPYRLADILRTADEQLGRLLDALEQRQLLDRTLIVVTADHGGQRDESYLGNGKYQSCCPMANVSAKMEPPFWLEHLNQIGALKTAYADTSVKLWLTDRSAEAEAAMVRGMSDISGMTEVYALRRSPGELRYERVFTRLGAQTLAFRQWAERHSAELVATMASERGPDLIGLLADGFGFNRLGDHGGAQEKVQRIPMIIHVPGERAQVLQQPFRLMDINAEVTALAGLDPPPQITPPIH